jgi:hypothetical protein
LYEKFGIPMPSKYVRDQQMICSEAVAETFWRAGFLVLPQNVIPLPPDFLESSLLERVFEGKILEDIEA